MKQIKTLFLFEWKKNRTTLSVGISLIIILLGCFFFGWISKASIPIVDAPVFIFQVLDYAESYELASKNYEEDSNINNYLALRITRQNKELQEEYRKNKDTQKVLNYLSHNLQSDWLQLLTEEQIEMLNYYVRTGQLPDELSEKEEKKLLKQAFTGSKKDYLIYEKYRQNELLRLLQEQATVDLTEEEKKANERYNQFYLENIELINYLEEKEKIEDWEIDLLALLLRNDISVIYNQPFLSETEFAIDLAMQQEYGDYKDYLEIMKENEESREMERKVQIYQLKNHIVPNQDEASWFSNNKVEITLTHHFAWGLAFTFILFLAFFGWVNITEHKKGQDKMILTRQYAYSTIWISKVLYFASIWIILCFYFFIFYCMVAMNYQVDLETMFVTSIGNNVVTYSFFYYLFENMLRLGTIYSVFLALSMTLGILTKSLSMFFVGTIILIGIGTLLPIELLSPCYLGSNLYLVVLISLGGTLFFQLGNMFLYQKKW